jgi:type II secretory pathway pseudopilin PulG
MKKAWASSHNTKMGFTIVELVVIIAVIAILATLTAISYSGIQAGSNDSQRTKDITQIKLALEKYHADNGSYPQVCGGDDTGCAASALSSSLQQYMSSSTFPTDPNGKGGPYGGYQYVRGPVANDSYGLLVEYEGGTDCKTGQHVNSNWWGTGYPICTNF